MKPLVRMGILLVGLLSFPVFASTNQPAPDFTLPTAQGEIELNKLQGQVVYLDFWASWCSPCRKSFPWMKAMQSRYGRDGLKVIAVNLDKKRELAERFLEELQAQFTVAFDPDGKVAEQYQLMGMPTSFLIDRQGKIHSTHVGFREPDKGRMEAEIEALLSQ
jgi:cytochrome c biogenesis protein CcmG/thiol:disulfide interchange protein DsbE